jgi:hypothetical protein
MIAKSNTNSILICFFYRDNLIKDERKSVMKLNSQLTQYLRMKLKKKLIKKKVKLIRPANQINQSNL